MRRFAAVVFFTASTFSALQDVCAIDVINTIAGNGANSNHADGIAATTAVITNVDDRAGVGVDSSGNIYYTDVQTIRRIDGTTGIITTVAGTGVAGFSGDNGPGTAAMINQPRGLCVDSLGNVFIADSKNQRIRKLNTATGVITTVAGSGGATFCPGPQFSGDGGPATAALLNEPEGVFVDGLNNIFIADSGNDCVRKVAAGTGIITTVAGQANNGGNGGDGGPPTSATLNQPRSIVVDAGGSLYIADDGNSRVRIVSGGMITNFAGNNTGMSGSGGNGGPATSAFLGGHLRLGIDSSNNIYIADGKNSSIRVVSSGIINPIAGTGTPGFSGDGGPALLAQFGPDRLAVAVGSGASPDVIIFDQGNFRIRKVHLGNISTVGGTGLGAFADGPGASSSFALPQGMFVDPAGNILICDTANFRIRRIDAASGAVSTIAGTGVFGYSGDGGAATSAQISDTQSLIMDSNGNIFLADRGNNCIRMINPAGIISTVAGKPGMGGFSGDGGPATSATLSEPDAVAINVKGDLFILDGADNVIRKVDTNGIITTVAGTPNMNSFSGDGGDPANAAFCGLNNFFYEPVSQMAYVSDGARIRKIDTQASIITTVAGTGVSGYSGDGGPATAAMLFNPLGVSANPRGDIFFADPLLHVVRKVDGATGIITTVAGNGVPGFSGDGGLATAAQLYLPTAVVPAPGGLYILDAGNNRVRRTGLAPNSGAAGIGNIAQGQPAVANPENGLSISVLSSDGGIIQLLVDVSQLRDVLDVETDFVGIGTRSGLVQGLRPVNQFSTQGVFVANVTASSLSSGVAKKGRKTLLVSGAEVGDPPAIKTPPKSSLLTNTKLKGKFAFTAPKDVLVPLAGTGTDLVTMSASFELPEGFDTSAKQEIDLGIGNIVDIVMIDAKGKGTVPGPGKVVKKLQVKYPKLAKGSTKTTAGQKATISVTMSGSNFSANGFDTEGVTNQIATTEKSQKSLSRSIQVGLVVGGIPYQLSAPVSFKLSSKGDSGTIGTRTGP